MITPTIITGNLATHISVNNRDTDEEGKLGNCQMLQEVSNINDRAIMETIGRLNFANIGIARYHVHFHEVALTGDTLKLCATYTYSDHSGLAIEIEVYKTKAHKKLRVLTGDFVFTESKNEQGHAKKMKEEMILLFNAK